MSTNAPALWPAPDEFQPQRWLDDDTIPVHRYAYFPFGGGPRQCIGNSFAEMEATLITATLCQTWTFTPAEHAEPVLLDPQVTLRPRSGITLTVAARAKPK